LFSIVCLFFAIVSDSCFSISITLCCAFAIACTFVACYTSTCILVDSCSSTVTTFPSLASFCTIFASTKCYSIVSSSSNSSMNTRSTDVALGPICSLTRQRCLLLHKKLNYKCFNYIYVLNYCLCKLYLFIIHLPSFSLAIIYSFSVALSALMLL
jgi:hypothetical protein